MNVDGLGRSPVVVSAVVKRKIVLTCGGWRPLTHEVGGDGQRGS